MRIDPAERVGLSPVFDLTRGDSPLIVSVPHDGRLLMPGQAAGMTPAGLALPDTDWHVRQLYEFVAGLGATVIAANYSRYVVDLNRSHQDEVLYPGNVSTGLCPSRTFAGEAIYEDSANVDPAEKSLRVERYWRPYHDELAAVVDDGVGRHGYVLLWDAHSIPSEVPRLFDGVLPDLNIGTNDGKSCARPVEAAVHGVARESDYSCVLNGRFRGGYITRHFGDPGRGVHALQLEIAQYSYMGEQSGEYREAEARKLQVVIELMLAAALDAASGL